MHADAPAVAERRWFPRFPFHARAVIVLEGMPQEGILLDLSFSGALFRAGARVCAGSQDRCLLEILHGASPAGVRAMARVAYSRDDLIGLQFGQVDFSTINGLMRIAEMNLGTPEMMRRELGALLQAPAGRLR